MLGYTSLEREFFLIQIAKKELYLDEPLSVIDGRVLLYYAYLYQNPDILDELAPGLMSSFRSNCTPNFRKNFGKILGDNHCFWKYIYPHLPSHVLHYINPKLLKKILVLEKLDYEDIQLNISYKTLIKYYPKKIRNFVKYYKNQGKLTSAAKVDIFDNSIFVHSFWGDDIIINPQIVEARKFYQNPDRRDKWLSLRKKEKHLTKIQKLILKTLKFLPSIEIIQQVFMVMLDFYGSQKNRTRRLKKRLNE